MLKHKPTAGKALGSRGPGDSFQNKRTVAKGQRASLVGTQMGIADYKWPLLSRSVRCPPEPAIRVSCLRKEGLI